MWVTVLVGEEPALGLCSLLFYPSSYPDHTSAQASLWTPLPLFQCPGQQGLSISSRPCGVLCSLQMCLSSSHSACTNGLSRLPCPLVPKSYDQEQLDPPLRPHPTAPAVGQPHTLPSFEVFGLAFLSRAFAHAIRTARNTVYPRRSWQTPVLLPTEPSPTLPALPVV